MSGELRTSIEVNSTAYFKFVYIDILIIINSVLGLSILPINGYYPFDIQKETSTKMYTPF